MVLSNDPNTFWYFIFIRKIGTKSHKHGPIYIISMYYFNTALIMLMVFTCERCEHLSCKMIYLNASIRSEHKLLVFEFRFICFGIECINACAMITDADADAVNSLLEMMKYKWRVKKKKTQSEKIQFKTNISWVLKKVFAAETQSVFCCCCCWCSAFLSSTVLDAYLLS